MQRMRWSGTVFVAVVAVVMGCNPSPPPTTPPAQADERRGGKSVKASKAPASTSPAPATSPSAGLGASPATSPVPSVVGASAPASPPTSVAPSAAAPSASPTSLATTNPTIAALGCKPAGAEVPVAASGGAVAAVYGHGEVAGLNVTRGTAVAIKAPPPVEVVLTSHPGAPAARIAAYEVAFVAGEGTTTAVGTATRLSIPPVDLPAAPATHFGRPAAIKVVLPVGQLKAVLADAATAPTVIKAQVRFFDAAGATINAKTINPLVATIPLPLGATAGAASLPPTEACAATAPSPAVPTPLPAGGGTDTGVMEWREVSPFAVTRSAAGVLSQTNVGIALAGPPGSTGARVDAMEATYTFTTEADAKAGKPPTNAGTVTTNLTPPVVVEAGTATAYGPSAFATLPFSDAKLAALTGAEGVVVVTYTFKSDEKGTINGPDGKPLKVTVPILVE